MKHSILFSMVLVAISQNVYPKKPIVKFFDKVLSKFSRTVEESSQEEFVNIKKIELLNQEGDIIITSWEQKSVALEIIKESSEDDLSKIKIEKKVVDKILQIENVTSEDIKHKVCFNLLVPVNTNLKLSTQAGIILISNVKGKIEAINQTGNIKIKNCNNTVKGETQQGNISVKSSKMQEDTSISLYTKKGSIKIYLNQNINAEIDAHAPHGKVSSALDIQLHSFKTQLHPKAWSDFKKQAHGIIGTKDTCSIGATTDHGSINIIPYNA